MLNDQTDRLVGIFPYACLVSYLSGKDVNDLTLEDYSEVETCLKSVENIGIPALEATLQNEAHKIKKAALDNYERLLRLTAAKAMYTAVHPK